MVVKALTPWQRKFENWLNNESLRKKLQYLYYFCILVPIFLTDAVIIYSLVSAGQADQQHQMENAASAIQYSISSFIEHSSVVATSLYMDDSIQDFLNVQYKDPEDYVIHFQEFMRNSLMQGIMKVDNTVITIYADNDTLVNGSGFTRLSDVAETPWYKKYKEGSLDTRLLFHYDTSKGRQIYFIRSLNRPLGSHEERFVKIDLDYSGLERNIRNMNCDFPVYICSDEEILISNAEANRLRQDFGQFTLTDDVTVQQDFRLYGTDFQINILRKSNIILTTIRERFPVLILLLIINIILPQMLMNLIARSITVRIHKLSEVFDQVDNDTLIKFSGEGGKDEIGSLLANYNRMADRMNNLIETVYRSRLKEQEMDIARQNAELLALYSQINPHFLFNALESIRMHSILKEEYETAGMVEKLAVMERQNVDWSTDVNTVKKELEFVEAYLALQKYRFGERLSYSVEIQQGCEDILVPKLTITTFVENACVHGIETKKAPGWIFVRVYTENQDLCIEVEDTGGGIEEADLEYLRDRMRNASIEMLKGNGRVGIVNACLRIRMMTDDSAQFSVESEKGIGTVILIRIPLKKTGRTE